ncbi:MAG: hypothetical protein CISAcid_18230 [uncultured Acidilobus sp. CIS]|nr:MAG: hypothetical protein CISAcid_18230 [uncultured Acidilobus sp. CIS]
MSPSIAKVVGHRSLDHILHYTEVRLAEEVLAGLRAPEALFSTSLWKTT